MTEQPLPQNPEEPIFDVPFVELGEDETGHRPPIRITDAPQENPEAGADEVYPMLGFTTVEDDAVKSNDPPFDEFWSVVELDPNK